MRLYHDFGTASLPLHREVQHVVQLHCANAQLLCFLSQAGPGRSLFSGIRQRKSQLAVIKHAAATGVGAGFQEPQFRIPDHILTHHA
jgi:hypothetical protein